jgi:hypothetical protein
MTIGRGISVMYQGSLNSTNRIDASLPRIDIR